MAARTKKNTEPASVAEVRAHFAENPGDLPEGATVGARGRLAAAVKDAYTAKTGRPVA